jgi:carbamate kinase
MKIVIALGGNALGNSPQEQLSLVKNTAKPLVDLIEEGHQLVIAHGNGPQVGMINLAMEVSNQKANTPIMPLGVWRYESGIYRLSLAKCNS